MNYYNEFDPKAAAWLRELIKHGIIPNGDVDERSIAEVLPTDLLGYTQCHFFAGIGGWSYALKLAGWPEDRPIWTGSCPCQPFSNAGKQLAEADERHLWPVFGNLIRECQPPAVFGEQVASKLGREWLSRVFTDLEGVGYAVAGADLCAASVGAPHIRQRLYWVGYSQRSGLQELWGNRDEQLQDTSRGCKACGLGIPNSSGRIEGQPSAPTAGYRNPAESTGSACGVEHAESDGRQQRWPESSRRSAISRCNWSDFDIIQCTDGKARRVESGSFPLANGVPGRVGLLRGYGNAIVPPLAAEFIKAASF